MPRSLGDSLDLFGEISPKVRNDMLEKLCLLKHGCIGKFEDIPIERKRLSLFIKLFVIL